MVVVAKSVTMFFSGAWAIELHPVYTVPVLKQ